MIKRLKVFSPAIIFILILIDQASKYFFESKSFFSGSFFYISYSQNFGSAFSFFENVSFYLYFIIVLSIIVLGIIMWKRDYFFQNILLIWTYILVVSGIIGNLIDRLLLGYVRDFIGIKYFSIFNFADIYLTFAFVLLIINEIKEIKKKK